MNFNAERKLKIDELTFLINLLDDKINPNFPRRISRGGNDADNDTYEMDLYLANIKTKLEIIKQQDEDKVAVNKK